MKCQKCGAEMPDTAKFCTQCGTELETAEPLENPAESSARPSQKETEEEAQDDFADEIQNQLEKQLEQELLNENGTADEGINMDEIQDDSSFPDENEPQQEKLGITAKTKMIAGGIIGILLLALIGCGFLIKQHHDLKHSHEHLLSMIEGFSDCESWTNETEKRFSSYILTEEEQKQFDALLEEEQGLKKEDYKNQISFVEEMKNFESEVKTRLDTEANKQLTDLKNQDPGYASNTEKQQLTAYAEEMQQLISDADYKKAEEISAKWKEYAKKAAQKKTGYTVSVMQYDLSNYPTVRLYLDIQDTAAGGLVHNLQPNMFYVSEKDAASGDFLIRKVKKAVQMNENERLNINLLADTSGSMMGSSLDSAKSIISNFFNTVQFQAGDQVKLTEFNSVIDKSGSFTNDIASLNNIINGYEASGLTKLYDTIIYGVQDVSGQEGAKCVIAFTDGMDEGSYNSAQEVVDTVKKYKIPVFIVRIGGSSYEASDGALRQIAEASGGSFKRLDEFSSDMSSFYDQIYRQMKQYYVVEYDSLTDQPITQKKDISVYIGNQDKGGETAINVNPGNEWFDTLLGGYLRSYIHDMNHHAYSQLSKYVDETLDPNDKWSIQWQMKKQVTGGFSNVTEETLMNYSISEMTMQDDNTILLKANENYDVIYDEVYGELKQSERDVAKGALDFLQQKYGYTELADTAQIRVWAKVNQIPQYIIKKGTDGQWKFAQYTGKLDLGEKRKVYDVEVIWQP